MAGTQGWYIGRIDVASVASVKGGGGVSVTDTVFQWAGAVKPTVATANITGLVSIVGGPYPTQAAATAAAAGDKNTTTATAGTGTSPAVSVSTVNSSNGHLPSPLTGLAAIGAFFAALSQASTWLRIGEGVLGLVLVAVGVARITNAVPIATKIAGAVR